MPTLRAAAAFCLNLIDAKTHLLAPGSLMIDVFIRGNYTADSNVNAMMVGFLQEIAEAVANTTGGEALRVKADARAGAVRGSMRDMDRRSTPTRSVSQLSRLC